MNLSGWLSGAFFLGVLAACWQHVKNLGLWLLSLVVVRARLEDEAGVALAALCWRTFTRSRFGERRYNSLNSFVRSVSREQVVLYEWAGTGPILFRRGWRLLLLTYEPGKNNDSMSAGLRLTFLRGVFDLDGLLVEAMDHLNAYYHDGNQSISGRFAVERKFGSGRWRNSSRGDSGPDAPPTANEVSRSKVVPDRRFLKWSQADLGPDTGGGQPWSALAFPESVLSLRDEARHWLESEQWYRQRGIPWRRGWLLYGAPGTGKTSLVRAVAQELDLPIIVFDLSTFSNNELVSAWRKLLQRSPCIALIEDIDGAFHGRDNVAGEDGGGLTFDCLLNCLSGIEVADGVLLVITTNRIEFLDPALGVPNDTGTTTRPGRIDRAIEFPPLDASCRRRIAERVLADVPWAIESLVAEGDNDTGAQFTERCARVALDQHWREGAAIPLHERNGHTNTSPTCQV